ncbi:hypothetical protein F8M41_019061 [Gigaspora margarita]|uniref:Uncharacterized protein n=1 Tax=Gigaspora margarita TaxID=4874 RepID=A0A8H4AKI8_GIGMA|nr:hypothetical protein F8M41_019061 [Gigaspora margarita]
MDYENTYDINCVSNDDIQENVKSSTSADRRKAINESEKSQVNKETECDKIYKYDRSTGNIKTHLCQAHGIFGLDELKLESNENY